jgi:hypothetical protein
MIKLRYKPAASRRRIRPEDFSLRSQDARPFLFNDRRKSGVDDASREKPLQ